MESLLQDLRHGVRTLARYPGFTTVTLITLILGIGANSAVFSIVNAVLLRPLPYSEPDRLARVFNEYAEAPEVGLSEQEVREYPQNVPAFETLAPYIPVDVNLTGGDEPERVEAVFASDELLRLLGVPAVLGRVYERRDDEPGAPPVALLSYGLWRRSFGADRAVIGRDIQVNGMPRTIVGVMPPGFDYPEKADLWMPLGLDPANPAPPQQRYLHAVARLRPGTSLAQTREQVDTYVARATSELKLNPEVGWSIAAVPLLDYKVGRTRTALWVLQGAAAFVLLIACANVANMLLVRTQTRFREISMRTVLGASRFRLVRQFLTESLLLAGLGGALGLLLGYWAVSAFVAWSPGAIPRSGEVSLDGRVVAFTLLATVLAGLAVALVPAWKASRPDLNETLKEGSKGSDGPGRQGSQRLLVVAEVSASLVLLVGAGLMIQSFVRLGRVDPGFRPSGVLTLQLALPRAKYPEAPNVSAFYGEVIRRLEGLPGVESVGLVSHLPFSGSNFNSSLLLEDRPWTPGQPLPTPNVRSVTPGYFKTMGIPLRQGRTFTGSDDAGTLPVVVIDETLAKSVWPGQDPIGKRVSMGSPDSPEPYLTIVGIVGAVRHSDLALAEERGEIYLPHAQNPDRLVYLVALAARTAGQSPTALTPSIREQIKTLDPDQPVSDVMTMDDRLARSLDPSRSSMQLLAVFAAVAVLLAAVGIYGVVSYSVAQRLREIGIRMALGAGKRDILRQVVGKGMVVVLVGVAVGLAIAFGLTRLLSSLLYEISVIDPATFVSVALLLTLVALLATLVPARRAAAMEPVRALREE
ncbi:MAG TPA: ABC transporter permease [Thermoanaerobaculia bacterium]|nr:ABC transporter permease [Thermoanaerobaculia bacterium]